MKIIKFLLIALLFYSCNKDEDIKKVPEGVVEYEVAFDINWSKSMFPTDYPSNAHFSKFIGWSHKSNSDFFKVGTLASNGIKSMAETGSISPLDFEINSRIEKLEGLELFVGTNLSGGVGAVKMNIYVDGENPSITIVSMIAPSPDWYIGVVGLSLLENNAFVESKTVEAIVYDSGTDGGDTFVSDNKIANPQLPIYALKSPPLGDGTSVKNIATVTFKRVK